MTGMLPRPVPLLLDLSSEAADGNSIIDENGKERELMQAGVELSLLSI
jgi:hypothetical protein